MAKGRKSTWRTVTSRILHKSILRQILINIFTHSLDNGTDHIFSKSTENTQLGGVVDNTDGKYLQRISAGWSNE